MELQNYSVPKKSPAASYTEKIHLNEFKNPPFFYFIWLYTFLFVCGKIILQYFLYTRTGGLSWPDGLYKAYLTVCDLPSELVSDLPYISLIIYAALFSTTAYNQGFKTALKSAIHLWFIILIVSIVPFFGLYYFLDTNCPDRKTSFKNKGKFFETIFSVLADSFIPFNDTPYLFANKF